MNYSVLWFFCYRRLECGVCGSKIYGLFGKQAYICQGTNLDLSGLVI